MTESTSKPNAIRIATTQATPVIVDAAATVEGLELLGEVPAQGTRLAMLPRCLPLNRANAWAKTRRVSAPKAFKRASSRAR